MASAASASTSRSVASTATRLSASGSGNRRRSSNEKASLTGGGGSVRGPDIRLRRHLILADQADRAGHPVRAVVAVAAGVLVQVLLVVALGVVEGPGLLRGPYLGGDVAKTVAPQHVLESLAGCQGRRLLEGGRPVDRAPVLRADVVALTEALRRVVVLPERLEQELRRRQ